MEAAPPGTEDLLLLRRYVHMTSRLVSAGSSAEAGPGAQFFSIQLHGLPRSMMSGFNSKCSKTGSGSHQSLKAQKPAQCHFDHIHWSRKSQSPPRLKERDMEPTYPDKDQS